MNGRGRTCPALRGEIGEALKYARTLVCGSCRADNRAGRKFCSECGQPLALACAECGAANEPTDRFCGECGAPLEGEATPRPTQVDAREAERRLVSVLFADLAREIFGRLKARPWLERTAQAVGARETAAV